MNTRLHCLTAVARRPVSPISRVASLSHELVAFFSWIVAAASGVGLTCVADDLQRATPENQQLVVSDIIRGIERGQRRLLEIEGGCTIQYRLDVDTDAYRSYAFKNPCVGTIRIKWPVVYNRMEADSTQDNSHETREAAYDFKLRTSIARSNNEVYVLPYRHLWSAVYVYPLRWQCYSTMSQSYYRGSELQTDYWLPEALKQHCYEPAGNEAVDGIPCSVVSRAGHDVLWVATQHSHVILRRDVYFGVGKPLRRRIMNKKLREIVDGVWLPMEQVMETFHTLDADPERWNTVARRQVLRITDVSVGDVQDADLQVAIRDGAKISDAIAGVDYVKNRNGDESLERGVRLGHAALLRAGEDKAIRRVSLYFWLNFVVLLTFGIVLMSRQIRGN